jgi:hypothetical protein
MIMRAGPTAQQKAEAVMDLLGGPCAATAASTRHYERCSVSPEASIEGAAGHSPWKGSKLTAAAAAAGGLTAAAAAAAAGATVAAARASASTLHEEEEEEEEDGVSVVGAGDGTIVIRITSSSGQQQAEKAGTATEQAAANQPAATAAAGAPKGVQQQEADDNDVLVEPQLLLAALKLSPAQAQQGLEEGRSRCSTGGGVGSHQHPAAAAAMRGSSSGGMAPGTPGGGSLGGLGSGGGSGVAPFKQSSAQSGPARDDSAGGMHAASLAKKLSAGGSPGAAGAAAHKQLTGSPLSRAQQQQQQGSPKGYSKGSYTKDASLQDLAQQLGFPGNRAAAAEHMVRAAGLNTVPAYFVSTAEHRSPPPAAALEAVKRPSSYSQRYQKRLSSSAGSNNTKQVGVPLRCMCVYAVEPDAVRATPC